MTVVFTENLTEDQKAQIHMLWDAEYPIKLQGRFSILLNENSNHEHFLILDHDGTVMAWTALFDNDGERRFSIIVSPAHAGKGLGKILLNAMKEKCDLFSGWVIDHENDLKQNGENYLSPLSFYLKNGFTVVPDCRLETDIISALKVRWEKSLSS